MAQTVDGTNCEKRFTLSSTPNETTRVNLPNFARRVAVFAESAAVKVSMSGTDAGAIGTNYMTVASGQLFERQLPVDLSPGDAQSIYIASTTGSAPVYVVVER